MSLPRPTRAVVTGAGSGLGRALCEELGARGARVLASDIDEAAARATAAACRAEAVRCDVSRLADVEALADEADRRLGGVDLVVNNAGVATVGRVGDVPIADWEWLIGVNLWGVVHGCHAFVPRLRARRAGHILNVASCAGLAYLPFMAPYNASKAAVVALSETLRLELEGDGVGVTVLCPTFFKTSIIESARGDGRGRDIARRAIDAAKMSARDVARVALDAVDRNELHVVPMADGRWIWRARRAFPRGYLRVVKKVLARWARREGMELGL
ncbi:MAG TPA: SDR family NAD(P)-dependent oxidoreductase [Haliangiales bacterium]|nr:SDR family NAD(P)-dependent oxidoreductase [Haliangiales bacterium]